MLLVLAAGCLHAFVGHAEEGPPAVVRLDWAYYNPLSLILRRQEKLEKTLRQEGARLEWVQSLGSNKALEFLRGNGVDFGSTAGAAALLGRANGNPIRAVFVYSRPEWTMLLTRSGSGIASLAQLRGRRIAVTRGTDPHVFLLRALGSAGLKETDVEIVPLQHPDGKTALERGDVDAWAGLDPYIAQLEAKGSFPVLFRNPVWNSTGVLNVREAFLRDHPSVVRQVLAAYEETRRWALDHPDEACRIFAEEAQLSPEVAGRVWSRNDLSDPSIGSGLHQVLLDSGEVLQRSGMMSPSADVPRAVNALLDTGWATKNPDVDHGAGR